MQMELGLKERGLASLRQGDAAAAVTLLTEAVRLDPADADACSALGVALCQTGRAPQGLLALRRAVELQPGRAPLRFNLARALELTGQEAEALEEFRRVLTLDPRHQSAAQGVQRLGSVAAPEPPHTEAAPVSEFLLPTGPPRPAPHGSSVVSPHTETLAAPAAAVPNPAPVPLPPRPQPVTVSAPVPSVPPVPAYAAGQPGVAAAPRKETNPWAIVAIVVGVFLVMGVAFVAVLAAVVLPAFKGAQEAARRSQAQPYVGTGAPGDPYRPALPPPGSIDVPAVSASGPQLDLTRDGGGPQIRDGGFGFGVDLPAGFPSPRLSGGVEPIGMGGTSRRTMYQSALEGRLAYVAVYAMPAEVYDRIPQARLYDLGQAALQSSAGQVAQRTSTTYRNYPTQEVRFSASSAGAAREGRGRIVLARPRVVVVAFESPEAGDLDQPAVNAFLDSLTIEEKENTPGVQAPIQMPASPSISTPPSVPGLPDTPGGPGGRFTPPPIPNLPRPTMPELPTRPDPSELEERLRSRMERFGPRGPRFTPGVPGPPSFGAPSSPGTPGSDSAPVSGAPTPGN